MFLKRIAASSAVSVCLTAPAFASDILPSQGDGFKKWGEVEGYTIYIDEAKNSCLAERIDQQENVLQMGLTEDQEFGYLGVFTKSDIDALDDGDEILLSLDGELFSGVARTKTGNLADGYQGGYVLTNNPNFVEAVQRKYEMIVFPEDDFAFIINLDGTFKAIEEARKCQASLSN